MNVTIETDFPVATQSYDHLHPFGTVRDNYSNSALVRKLSELCFHTVLDIGCAGGGFVQELAEAGLDAIGIEGSDINLKTKRAAWAAIPNNLFTADATKPFTVKFAGEPAIFEVVTCWEFFEHIEEVDFPQLFDNIRRHTVRNSQLICSIANFPSPHEGIDLHRTQKELPFWINTFKKYDFHRDEYMERFYESNWVRTGTYNLVLRRGKA